LSASNWYTVSSFGPDSRIVCFPSPTFAFLVPIVAAPPLEAVVELEVVELDVAAGVLLVAAGALDVPAGAELELLELLPHPAIRAAVTAIGPMSRSRRVCM
jgi:hypothetical protein